MQLFARCLTGLLFHVEVIGVVPPYWPLSLWRSLFLSYTSVLQGHKIVWRQKKGGKIFFPIIIMFLQLPLYFSFLNIIVKYVKKLIYSLIKVLSGPSKQVSGFSAVI